MPALRASFPSMVQGRLRLTYAKVSAPPASGPTRMGSAPKTSARSARQADGPTRPGAPPSARSAGSRWSDQTLVSPPALTARPENFSLTAHRPLSCMTQDLCLVCLGEVRAQQRHEGRKNCPRAEASRALKRRTTKATRAVARLQGLRVPQPDGNSCLECDPGYSCAGPLKQSVIRHVLLSGRKERCPAGRSGRSSQRITHRRLPQPPGTYQPERADILHALRGRAFPSKVAAQTRADCRACAVKGYYCPAGTGNETEHPCEKGTFSNTEAATTCVVCPEGYFQARAGRTNCTGCSAGQFLADQGVSPVYHDEAEDCSVCPANMPTRRARSVYNVRHRLSRTTVAMHQSILSIAPVCRGQIFEHQGRWPCEAGWTCNAEQATEHAAKQDTFAGSTHKGCPHKYGDKKSSTETSVSTVKGRFQPAMGQP